MLKSVRSMVFLRLTSRTCCLFLIDYIGLFANERVEADASTFSLI